MEPEPLASASRVSSPAAPEQAVDPRVSSLESLSNPAPRISFPDIPEQSLKLKVDAASGNIQIEEENLLRLLAKLRDYVKDALGETLYTVRKEVDAQVQLMRQESEVSIKEAVCAMADELKSMHAELDSLVHMQGSDLQAVSSQVELLQNQMQNVASSDGLKDLPTPVLTVSSLPSTQSRQSSPRRMNHANTQPSFGGSPTSSPKRQVSEGDDAEPPPQTFRSKSLFVAPDVERVNVIAYDEDTEEDQDVPGSVSRRHTVDGNAIKSMNFSSKKVIETLNGIGEDQEAEDEKMGMSRSMSVGMTHEQEERLEELFQACKSIEDHMQEYDEKDHMHEETELRLGEKVDDLEVRVKDAEAQRRLDTRKAHKQEEAARESEHKLNFLHGRMLELEQEITSLEKAKAPHAALLTLQAEVDEVQKCVSQAALAAVIEPKMDGALFKLERLTKECSRTDEQLEQVASRVREMDTEFNGRLSGLGDLAPRKEVEQRCQGLDQQMSSLSQLLTEVETSLGDLSSAILSLSSKAERTDLNTLREEMCHISESVKDREQAVLFGARCLSCNRVFDDVSKDTNAVDLNGEKQRNALFTQVQRALHSPRIDPLAKIKVLAVKVGRPLTVPGSGGMGNFEGRDGASFACGVDDVQLVSFRESASNFSKDLHVLPRPEGVPRISKGRRLKGAPQREVKYQSDEGPMDFKHPLSHLVDRSPDRGPVRNRAAAAL